MELLFLLVFVLFLLHLAVLEQSFIDWNLTCRVHSNMILFTVDQLATTLHLIQFNLFFEHFSDAIAILILVLRYMKRIESIVVYV